MVLKLILDPDGEVCLALQGVFIYLASQFWGTQWGHYVCIGGDYNVPHQIEKKVIYNIYV